MSELTISFAVVIAAIVLFTIVMGTMFMFSWTLYNVIFPIINKALKRIHHPRPPQ